MKLYKMQGFYQFQYFFAILNDCYCYDKLRI